MSGARAAPGSDCALCPRLVAFRAANRAREPGWHNAPVASFGDPDAPLLIVGLAPGLRGANRTGRPFTGDVAGELLYQALARHGLSRGRFAASPSDGLELVGCRVTNAVRCVPPENRPLPAEIGACRRFLRDELDGPAPRVVLCLGRIAHDSVLRALGLPPTRYRFAHGAVHHPEGAPSLVASYHTSRYNVQTGRITAAMFDAVVGTAVGLCR